MTQAMTQALTLRPNSLPTLTAGSLDAYINSVNAIPVLSAEEEQRLAFKLRDEQDLQAAQTLILSNLRFVVHVARGYSGYGLQLADLIQEGNIGLMKAVKRFDPEVGVRLISFAVHWIRAEIHEFVLRNWRIVKVATTKAQRKLFFNLRGAKKRLGWMNQQEVEAVAKDLNVKPETVLQMERRLSAHDVSFSATPVSGGSEDEAYGPEDYLPADDGYDPGHAVAELEWDTHQTERLQSALATLDDRSRDILYSRWLSEKADKVGLKELGEKHGISAERVRQVENQAIRKLRAAMA